MKNEKIFYCFGIIWEIVRFLFFFLFITFIYIQPTLGGTQSVLWLLFLCSSQLLMPAGFTLLLFDSTKFQVVIQLLRIGKILSLIPSFFIFFDEFILSSGFFTYPLTGVSLLKKSSILLLSISIFFDLIFLYFLLSFKVKRMNREDGVYESSHLPEYTITEVKSVFDSKDDPQK
ncbi:MAG: hypothetical protein JXJ04_13580 [Spirochaetales bacterium]|nr:hypothetical protein [Spirochaetales bacterium]